MIYWSKRFIQNPPSLITGWTMSNLHYNRSILFHSFLQNFLNSLILEGFPARTESSCPWASGHKVMGRHSPSGFVCMMFLLECCVSFVPDVMEPMSSRKFYFWLISPENIIQKFWGSWRCFLVNLRWTFCLLFGQHCFTLSLTSTMVAILAQCLSYCGVMTIDLCQ